MLGVPKFEYHKGMLRCLGLVAALQLLILLSKCPHYLCNFVGKRLQGGQNHSVVRVTMWCKNEVRCPSIEVQNVGDDCRVRRSAISRALLQY